MRPQFYPSLVNDRFGDPGVFVDFLMERRAILFDLGDIAALPPRAVLRLTDVFVSHAHIDQPRTVTGSAMARFSGSSPATGSRAKKDGARQ